MTTVKIPAENKFHPFLGLSFFVAMLLFCGTIAFMLSDPILFIMPVVIFAIFSAGIYKECFSGRIYIAEIVMSEDRMVITRKKRGKVYTIETLEYSEIAKCHLRLNLNIIRSQKSFKYYYTTEFTAERTDGTKYPIRIENTENSSPHPYLFALYLMKFQKFLPEFTYKVTGLSQRSLYNTLNEAETGDIDKIVKKRRLSEIMSTIFFYAVALIMIFVFVFNLYKYL